MKHRSHPQQSSGIPVEVFQSALEASQSLADEISRLIKDRDAKKETTVLGLATGSTPVALYRELIRRHREDDLSFARVITFNLDEYYGLEPSHEQSYRRFMEEKLFAHIDIPKANTHVPNGKVGRNEVEAHCQAYEQAIEEAGGIDLQILGIGRTGHIGFNEPGSGPDSITRLVGLDRLTRRDAAGAFGGEAKVPTHAITMGVGTIFKAAQIVLMAWGESKAEVVAKAIEGPVTDELPASFLQKHGNTRFFVDEAAARSLSTESSQSDSSGS